MHALRAHLKTATSRTNIAVADIARLEGALDRVKARIEAGDPAMRRLLQEHRGVRAQRMLMPKGTISGEECAYLKVEVGMAKEVLRMIRKEMGAVPRLDEQ